MPDDSQPQPTPHADPITVEVEMAFHPEPRGHFVIDAEVWQSLGGDPEATHQVSSAASIPVYVGTCPWGCPVDQVVG